ncbi:MAG: glycosyltransferase family 2 protein, partial [Aristaeellaceae bacterium]
MELVSILIPCYNDGVYLDDALTSVEAQTWPAVEVIVVDDGSTDPDTVATLDRLAGEKRCTLYRQANKGPSAARNLAAQKASGAYYFFLDADNILLPTYIEKALEQFRRNPKLGVCYARAELFGDASGLWELPEFSVQQMLIDNVVEMCALVSREA